MHWKGTSGFWIKTRLFSRSSNNVIKNFSWGAGPKPSGYHPVMDSVLTFVLSASAWSAEDTGLWAPSLGLKFHPVLNKLNTGRAHLYTSDAFEVWACVRFLQPKLESGIISSEHSYPNGASVFPFFAVAECTTLIVYFSSLTRHSSQYWVVNIKNYLFCKLL